jgi:hypothetical protein
MINYYSGKTIDTLLLPCKRIFSDLRLSSHSEKRSLGKGVLEEKSYHRTGATFCRMKITSGNPILTSILTSVHRQLALKNTISKSGFNDRSRIRSISSLSELDEKNFSTSFEMISGLLQLRDKVILQEPGVKSDVHYSLRQGNVC